jgi:hypothetical protein
MQKTRFTHFARARFGGHLEVDMIAVAINQAVKSTHKKRL